MAIITITLIDAQRGRVSVRTDAERPVPGASVSPAQALAVELLGTAFRRGAEVIYDAASVPTVALALELLDPDALGWAATPEIADGARRALGRSTTRPADAPGVDIDLVHRGRGVTAP